MASPASALQIYPPTITAGPGARHGEVTVRNPGAEAYEVTIGFRYAYPHWDEQGRRTVRAGPGPDPRDITPHLRAFPPRFRLAPHASQIVRILVRRPKNAAPREYWGRILIHGVPATPPKPAAGASVRVGFQLDVPFLYRAAVLTPSIALDGVRMAREKGGLRLVMRLRPSRTVAYLGRATAVIDRLDGTPAAEGRTQLAVYEPGSVPLLARGAKGATFPPGRYRVRLTLETRDPNLPPEAVLAGSTVRRTFEVVLE